MRLPLLFSEGYVKGRITLNHFVALAAGNAAKIYGMDHCKGSISEGRDADIAIWDPESRRVVRAEEMHDNMEFTPVRGDGNHGLARHRYSTGRSSNRR